MKKNEKQDGGFELFIFWNIHNYNKRFVEG